MIPWDAEIGQRLRLSGVSLVGASNQPHNLSGFVVEFAAVNAYFGAVAVSKTLDVDNNMVLGFDKGTRNTNSPKILWVLMVKNPFIPMLCNCWQKKSFVMSLSYVC